MSFRYWIRSEERVVLIRYEGVVTLQLLADARAAFSGDPAFRPEFDSLTDLSAVTGWTLTGEELMDHGLSSPFLPESRVAVVARRDLDFGLARVFEAAVSSKGRDSRICRDMEEAEAWLGLKGGA